MQSGINTLNNVMSELMTTKKQEGDYIGKDGLLYCGKCKTRKQFEIEILGKMRIVPVMCDCKKQEFEKQQTEEKARKIREQTQQLKIDGIADTEYLKWTFAKDKNSESKVSKAARRYVHKWQEMKENNIGILFYGDVGTGKTFLAACIANALIDKAVPVLMTNIPLLISAMQKDFEAEKATILRRISSIPLLILDDIGVERDTAYGYEKVQEIIDTRYRSGKPLIVTTNLSPQELQNPTDIRYKRVYDRILEMCHPILVNGESQRKRKAAEKRNTARNMLGI